MLLDFKGSNFKSFGDDYDFRMTPERISELGYSVIKEKIGHKPVKGLSTSVIYGPNASGKTSLINAMSVLRQIVIRGNIRNTEDDRSNDHVSPDMSLIPFKFSKKAKPVIFDITFTYKGVKYRYILSMMLGKFLQTDYDRYISDEELFINDRLIFKRSSDSVEELSVESIIDRLNKGYDIDNTVNVKQMMSGNITRDSLLLTTDFNSFCSKTVVSDIVDWFTNCFLVINSANHALFIPAYRNGSAVIDTYINRIAKEAGILGSDFAYVKDSDNDIPKLMTVLKKSKGQLTGIDSAKIESVGTMRLISVMPVILAALQRGATLVMDEFDASLHPSIVMNLITIFHNDEVNKNHAQLIFNTQNPVYLNRKLLRRDEIKFVERDEDTKSGDLYELANFQTNGEKSVRKTSDYMKNYFVNRYGAILDIDFTDIISDMMDKATERKN